MPEVFEKLQELVLDENKVVTYKTLCRTLQIHANKAKQYLTDFFDKYGDSHDLSAFYIIIGLSSDKKTSKQYTRIALASNLELDKTKKEFSSISSMHLYAVHKGKLLDENVLYNTDYGKMDRVEDYNRFSCIKNPHIYVQVEQQVKPVFIPNDTNSHNLWKPNPPNNQTSHKNETPKITASKSKNPNLFTLFQKKNEDSNNAANQADDPQQDGPTSKSKKPSPVQNKSSKSSVSSKNDVKYFFAKQAEKPPKSQMKNNDVLANSDAPGIKGKESSKTTKELKSSPETNNSSSSRQSSRKTKSEKSKLRRNKAKRGNADDSDEDFMRAKKKHKRIVTMEDSDSESENEQEADRAQRELFDLQPAPSLSEAAVDSDEEIIPPTQPVNSGKKKWKVVTKTFEDEDGFFVTKKEKELVTDSEDSSNENPPKSLKKESPKASPIKKKQSSLMNFFKQK